MGQEERAELSKLASIYKIRCRYGKSAQVASSTLMKARCALIRKRKDKRIFIYLFVSQCSDRLAYLVLVRLMQYLMVLPELKI